MVLKIIFVLLLSVFLTYWIIAAGRDGMEAIKSYRTRKAATQVLLEHMGKLVDLYKDSDKKDKYLSFCLAMTLLAPPPTLEPIAQEVQERSATPETGAWVFSRLRHDLNEASEGGKWYFKLKADGQTALLDIQGLVNRLQSKQ